MYSHVDLEVYARCNVTRRNFLQGGWLDGWMWSKKKT
jgi:hypothetical protein